MQKPACHVLAFAPGRQVPAGAVGHTGRTASEGREVQQLGICGTGGAGSCCAERLNTLFPLCDIESRKFYRKKALYVWGYDVRGLLFF